MKITRNFSLNEFIKSSTATRLGISNQPSAEHLVNLTAVSLMVLQPVREHYGKVVGINSGYRSPELNKAVRGSATSQHCNGQAADVEIQGLPNYELAKWIQDNLNFDQLILEFYTPGGDPNSGWVHCSYNAQGENRKKVMTAVREGGKTAYKSGLLK